MRRLRLYLETSLWSHYFHDDVPERQGATRFFLDGLHVAYATVYEMDALISWNQKHLANLTRRMKVVAVNLQQGYGKPLEMLTGWEVMDSAEGDE